MFTRATEVQITGTLVACGVLAVGGAAWWWGLVIGALLGGVSGVQHILGVSYLDVVREPAIREEET